MLSLSPAKILVVLVVALIVLGPEKLPGVARQLGALWGDLRRWRSRLESEVRGVFPDLPPTHEVAQVVRSPLTFLNRLADEHERSLAANGNSAVNGANASSDGVEVTGTWAPPSAPSGGEGHEGSGPAAPAPEGAQGPPPAGVEQEQLRSDTSAGTVWFATSVGAEEALSVAPDDPSMN
jgi:Sec-independent protein translocase protein TatA